MGHRNIAIIPARGGSKRIPRKNVKEFLGKPVIAYSISAALESKLFDEVMVSTDDEEIAKVAQTWGAKVPFMRSPTNSDDFASTDSVLKEVLLNYKDRGSIFDLACCIYPVAPLVTANKLTEAHDQLQRRNLDCCFPVCRYSSPIWRSFQLTDGLIKMTWPENESKRSQDLPDTFFDAGQFYWFRSSSFLSSGGLLGEATGGIVLDELQVQDIDSMTDWKLAEMKFKLMKNL